MTLAIIQTLAFLAVYAASGVTLRWSSFFATNFNRAEYLRERFFADFSFTPELAVAIFAGLAVCVFAAMIQAPLFHAIAGPRYPLAPRGWVEAGRLMLFYFIVYLVVSVMPLALPIDGRVADFVLAFTWVIVILVIFADYVIVFEDLPVLPAVRRSLQLLGRRWLTVLLIFVIFQLIYFGLHALYDLYYQGAGDVFALLPISQVLIESFVALLAHLVLIFLYEAIRRHSPS